MFYNIGPRCQCIKLFYLIYTTSSIFWCDLDRGYADGSVIMLQIVLERWPQVSVLFKNFGIIYITTSLFPHDFDWGYADSGVFKLNKFRTLTTGVIIFKLFVA